MAKGSKSAAFPSEGWVRKWVDVINGDSEIERLGRWFDARVMFQFGDDKYILKFNRGRVDDVITQPIWDKAWDFGVRATVDCWRHSMKDPPPPFYQDIFGMMWNHGMTLEADVIKAMQNIRALKLVMGSMKRVR
jgi:hypothetical protein